MFPSFSSILWSIVYKSVWTWVGQPMKVFFKSTTGHGVIGPTSVPTRSVISSPIGWSVINSVFRGRMFLPTPIPSICSIIRNYLCGKRRSIVQAMNPRSHLVRSPTKAINRARSYSTSPVTKTIFSIPFIRICNQSFPPISVVVHCHHPHRSYSLSGEYLDVVFLLYLAPTRVHNSGTAFALRTASTKKISHRWTTLSTINRYFVMCSSLRRVIFNQPSKLSIEHRALNVCTSNIAGRSVSNSFCQNNRFSSDTVVWPTPWTKQWTG